MRCIPLDSEKIELIDGFYYMRVESSVLHSFNDQPYSVFGAILIWRKDNRLHRGNDKPAVINLKTGEKRWYTNDKLIKEMNSDGTITIY